MLIAIYRLPAQVAAAVPDAAAAPGPAGAAVSWVDGRFFVHGVGEVTAAALGALDVRGELEWVNVKACAWVRAGSGGPASGVGSPPAAVPAGGAPTVSAQPSPRGALSRLWDRISVEHLRVATYIAVGAVAIIVIVLLAQR